MKFLKSATPTRFANGKHISSKSEQPHICQHKWSNEIYLPPDEKIDWRAVYQLAFQCSKSSKMITFNYKLLHRLLATNMFLKKIRVLEDDKFTFWACHSEAESLLHLTAHRCLSWLSTGLPGGREVDSGRTNTQGL